MLVVLKDLLWLTYAAEKATDLGAMFMESSAPIIPSKLKAESSYHGLCQVGYMRMNDPPDSQSIIAQELMAFSALIPKDIFAIHSQDVRIVSEDLQRAL